MAAARRRRLASVALTVLLGGLLGGLIGGLLTSPAASASGDGDRDGDGALPSTDEVAAAESAAADARRTVAAVRTDLVLADQRLRATSIRAAQAAEAFNAARYQLSLAREEARRADLAGAAALAALDRQREAYAASLASAYKLTPELTALSAIVRSEGIGTVVDRATTLTVAEDALDAHL